MRATSSQIGGPNSEPCLLKVTRQPGLAVPDRELDLILNLLRHLNMSEISSWQINSSRTVTETHWFSRFKAFICSEERKMWQEFAMKDCYWLETKPVPTKTEPRWGHPGGIHYDMRDSVLRQIRKEAVKRRWKILEAIITSFHAALATRQPLRHHFPLKLVPGPPTPPLAK